MQPKMNIRSGSTFHSQSSSYRCSPYSNTRRERFSGNPYSHHSNREREHLTNDKRPQYQNSRERCPPRKSFAPNRSGSLVLNYGPDPISPPRQMPSTATRNRCGSKGSQGLNDSGYVSTAVKDSTDTPQLNLVGTTSPQSIAISPSESTLEKSQAGLTSEKLDPVSAPSPIKSPTKSPIKSPIKTIYNRNCSCHLGHGTLTPMKYFHTFMQRIREETDRRAQKMYEAALKEWQKLPQRARDMMEDIEYSTLRTKASGEVHREEYRRLGLEEMKEGRLSRKSETEEQWDRVLLMKGEDVYNKKIEPTVLLEIRSEEMAIEYWGFS